MKQKIGYFMHYTVDGKPIEVDIVNEKELDKHLDTMIELKSQAGESYAIDFKQNILDLKKEVESRGKK